MNSYEKVKYNELQVGDVVVGRGDSIWYSEYEIIQIREVFRDKVRVYLRYGTSKTPYTFYSTHTFNIKSRYMPYDPSQQGDTDEDI